MLGRNTRKLLNASSSEETKRKIKRNVLELVAALKQCSKARDFESGEKLHQEAADAGWDTTNKYVCAALITFYSKCRKPALARQVFDKTPALHRDAFTWTNLILGYADNGLHAAAMDLFDRMDCQPTEVTYVAALKACAGLASSCGDDLHKRKSILAKGTAIHNKVRAQGFELNIVLANTLVDMYCKCGSMKLAKDVFDGNKMIHKNAVTWTCLILGYVENGQSSLAVDLFESMDCLPDSVTFVAVFKALTALSKSVENKTIWLQKGKDVHRQLRECGFASSKVIGNTLIDMYGNFGCMDLAGQVFDTMIQKDVVTWTCLILGYVENGEHLQAMEVFNKMDCEPDLCSYIAILKACAALASENASFKEYCLAKGISIHKQLGSFRGLSVWQDVVLATALLDMYSKCGSLSSAKDVFEGMVRKDVVAWTCIIQGYSENGENDIALELFHCMDCQPNAFALASALKACGGLASSSSTKNIYLDKGMAIHSQARDGGLDESDVVVGAALVDMYSKFGHMQLAREAFDRMLLKNSVPWTCLILGYVENGDFMAALDVFDSIDCEPSSFTYVAALKACGGLAGADSGLALDKGRGIHDQVRKHGLASNTFAANTLVDMYTKCGSMSEAEEVFKCMTSRNAVAWNCMIVGYLKNRQSSKALDLFMEMVVESEPDMTSYAAALRACGGVGALPLGQAIHATVCRLGLEQGSFITTALICLYTKCGSMTKAELVFYSGSDSSLRDIVPWSALMAGYSSIGDWHGVFELVYCIQGAALRMDRIIAISILTACSHAGKVEEGRRYFEVDMPREGISPSLDHYNCMVDLFGRANRFDEAMKVIRNMPVASDQVTWMTLLGACRKWRNLEVARVAFDELVARGECSAAYVLMSDIYGGLSMWEHRE